MAQLPSGWLKAMDKATGRPLYVGIPSGSATNKYHIVSTAGCDCISFQYRRTCKHFRALMVALRNTEREQIAAQAATRQPLVGRLSA